MVWRGDGVAERASLENWRPRKGSASSNLAPSATDEIDVLFFSHSPFMSISHAVSRGVARVDSIMEGPASARILKLTYPHGLTA
jgi:hypothetical protein